METKNPIFTSVITGSPTITSEKLIDSENYFSWSAFVELWFMGQGYEDHLITLEDAIPNVDKVQWKKIDAQLCNLLWQSIDPKMLLHLRAYKTCFKFWTQAKGLYTNDIQRLYKVAFAIVNIRQQDMNLSNYIGQITSLKEEFLTLMPLTSDVRAQQTQIDKFFMVLTLIGLRLNHLITLEDAIPNVDKVQWKKIDAQLCSLLWQSIDPKILLHLRAYKTCFKFWTQAKGLYMNDIQRLYKVASAIVNIRQQDMDLSNYISQIASLKEKFLTLMPLTSDVGAQQTHIDKFFMVLTLIGLHPNLETVRDHILGSPSVPPLDDVFARLLRISSTQTLPSDSISDFSVLVSQTNPRGGRSGNRGRGQRPHCTYCNKLSHTRDRCYQLHGCQPTAPSPSHCPHGPVI